MKRAAIIDQGSPAKALQTAETKKSSPTEKSVRLRPRRSLTAPPKIDPSTVPQRADDTTHPCIDPLRFQSF